MYQTLNKITVMAEITTAKIKITKPLESPKYAYWQYTKTKNCPTERKENQGKKL